MLSLLGRTKNGSKGFSLVEIVIVISLIGIIATIAVPNFRNYIRNRSLKIAAQEIASEIFITRGRAVAENRTYRMVFNSGSNQYTTEEQTAPGVWTVRQTKAMAGEASETAGIVINAANTTATIFTFQPRGTVSSGTLSINNSINSIANVTVNFPSRTYVTYTLQ